MAQTMKYASLLDIYKLAEMLCWLDELCPAGTEWTFECLPDGGMTIVNPAVGEVLFRKEGQNEYSYVGGNCLDTGRYHDIFEKVLKFVDSFVYFGYTNV